GGGRRGRAGRCRRCSRARRRWRRSRRRSSTRSWCGGMPEEEDEEEPGKPRPPRIFTPMVAAGMIALSLERLGFLAWPAALGVFLALAAVVAWIATRSRPNQAA